MKKILITEAQRAQLQLLAALGAVTANAAVDRLDSGPRTGALELAARDAGKTLTSTTFSAVTLSGMVGRGLVATVDRPAMWGIAGRRAYYLTRAGARAAAGR